MDGTPGLLVACMAIPSAYEEEFNDWYNTEHVPERMSVPGFLAARRFHVGVAEYPYLCLYDLDSIAVLRTAAYSQSSARPVIPGGGSPWSARLSRLGMHVSRRVYEQTSDAYVGLPGGHGRALLLETFDVPPHERDSFNRWQREAYLPALASAPGVLRVRTFTVAEGGPHHLTLADLAQAELLGEPTFLGVQLEAAAARLRFELSNLSVLTYQTIFEYPERWTPGERAVDWSSLEPAVRTSRRPRSSRGETSRRPRKQ